MASREAKVWRRSWIGQDSGLEGDVLPSEAEDLALAEAPLEEHRHPLAVGVGGELRA